MSKTAAIQNRSWHMPVVPDRYDRSPLTAQEKDALATVARQRGKARGVSRVYYANANLGRLQRPIYDVVALRSNNPRQYQNVRRVLYREMLQRGTSFWQWSKDEWLEIICANSQEFVRKYGSGHAHTPLMDIAYLLGGVTDFREAGQEEGGTEMARFLFGPELVEEELRRITDVLVGPRGQGYSSGPSSIKSVRQALFLLFLLNRSPYLEDLSLELIQGTIRQSHSHTKQPNPLRVPLLRIQKALQALHLIPETPKATKVSRMHVDTTGISPEWARWCLAWFEKQPKINTRRRTYYTSLLTVGRWLADRHPEIVSPEQWDENLALEYVSYICTTAVIGDYTSLKGCQRLAERKLVGKPLAPSTRHHKLAAMSRFFTDLQHRPHAIDGGNAHKIEPRFNPSETFVLPRSIRSLIQPDPRDIDEVIWCKLTYAAATLSEENSPLMWSGYPLSFHRALALLWVTSARRANEIVRLQVGCIRRDWDPTMLDEQGDPTPGQEAQLCYLHVPSNKTKGAYWVPIPKYAADAVETWELERPSLQLKQIDTKDNTQVDFLFSLRGKRMGQRFLNSSLIPLLCQSAGVPEQDARGAITSHRARSTIATMLRKNGLSLDDISQFLGHANPQMVRAYARTDPFRFGREMNKANDLVRIVEGIIDTRAARAGKPNVFFFLGKGSDGQSRFCGNPAWEKCRHRLACLKCPMYVGASHASRLAERLETRDEIFKFQTQVEMTPQEKAASEGDIQTLTELIDADKDVPPPAPPSDEFRFNAQSQINTEALPQDPQTDLVALGRRLADLNRNLAAAEKRTDGRNAFIRSLKKQIADVTEQMAALDQITSITMPTLGM